MTDLTPVFNAFIALVAALIGEGAGDDSFNCYHSVYLRFVVLGFVAHERPPGVGGWACTSGGGCRRPCGSCYARGKRA